MTTTIDIFKQGHAIADVAFEIGFMHSEDQQTLSSRLMALQWYALSAKHHHPRAAACYQILKQLDAFEEALSRAMHPQSVLNDWQPLQSSAQAVGKAFCHWLHEPPTTTNSKTILTPLLTFETQLNRHAPSWLNSLGKGLMSALLLLVSLVTVALLIHLIAPPSLPVLGNWLSEVSVTLQAMLVGVGVLSGSLLSVQQVYWQQGFYKQGQRLMQQVQHQIDMPVHSSNINH